MIDGIITKAAVTARIVLAGCSARSIFAVFPGTGARASLASTLLATVILFEGVFLLGYSVLAPKPATAPIRVESPANLPASASNTTALRSEQKWDTVFLGRPMTYYQQYTCYKFGPACRIALAIQSAENLKGDCEAYNYNTNGTLDWGYFQINSVHINRGAANLRDLLDCEANIDFAYQLYKEEGFQPWSTFVTGQYRQFLDDSLPKRMADPRPRPAFVRAASIPGSTVTASGYRLDCAMGRCAPAFQ